MTLDGIRFPPPAGGDETFWRLLAASVGDPTIEKMAQVRAT
jgi:hypothetical protein